MSRFGPDFLGVLKGIQMVANESLKLQENYASYVWKHSSMKSLVLEANIVIKDKIQTNIGPKDLKVDKFLNEALERTRMIPEGVKAIAFYMNEPKKEYIISDGELVEYDKDKIYEDVNLLLQGNIASKNLESKNISNLMTPTRDNEKLSPHPSQEHPANISKEKTFESKDGDHRRLYKDKKPIILSKKVLIKELKIGETKADAKSKKFKQTLSETAKQRKVPASRFGRMLSFGSLAAGLGIGTVAEMTRRSLGINQKESQKSQTMDSAFLTPANAERIVNTLCEVRGAALKLGQLLSIQDNNVISPVLQDAFERVRQSADFMPQSQIEKVLISELGENWSNKFSEFNMVPFAAASIGQVHFGKLHNGTEVAVKVQYPGVAKGIDSDIDNLVSVLKVWNIFPEGMFIDKIIEVAKKELAWEVDYEREAKCTKKFKKLLEPYHEYYVPNVIDELSTKQIITTELIDGIPVDKCFTMDNATRKRICSLIMQLCLRELFQFRYMQTDPNWSNFFYNQDSGKLILLDFGASRYYEKKFMDEYIQIIKAAAEGDKKQVLKLSRKMGFLTGFESKAMEQAHIDTVMILGEPFSEKNEEFDFGNQNTTLRVTQLVPTIVNHRLCPPPEEIYSLHRKLSGVFLLCSKLKVKMACRQMFLNVYDTYIFND